MSTHTHTRCTHLSHHPLPLHEPNTCIRSCMHALDTRTQRTHVCMHAFITRPSAHVYTGNFHAQPHFTLKLPHASRPAHSLCIAPLCLGCHRCASVQGESGGGGHHGRRRDRDGNPETDAAALERSVQEAVAAKLQEEAQKREFERKKQKA
jgi:hypothetical protein